jgi:hypothetical protein
VLNHGRREGAYLLRAASVADAEEWVTRDPLVASGRCQAELLEWDLVGINADALDPTLLLRGDGATTQ